MTVNEQLIATELDFFMNVLLVSPDFGLQAAVNEVRQVSMSLHAVILNGTVTRKDLVDTLGDHKWDAIWFATHGDQKGIRLSDNVVNIADLTAIVRNSGAYLVVLNSCSSRYVGLELHYELGVDVITTEADADDISAYQTGALLARNLANGLTVFDAFERSRPGQKSMYYLFTRQQRDDESEIRTIKMLNEAVATIKKMIDDGNKILADRVDRLERRVDGKIETEAQRVTQVEKSVYALEYTAKTAPPVPLSISGKTIVAIAILATLLVMIQVTLLTWFGALPHG